MNLLEQPAGTATLRRIHYDDGVALLTVTCDRCGAQALHGGGRDPSQLLLGHRVSHCGCCDGYTITDRLGLADRRVDPPPQGAAA